MTSYNLSSNSDFFARSDRFFYCGPFRFDLSAQQLKFKGNDLELPHCTFNYLVALARHFPNPVSFKQLVADAQGYVLPALEAQDLARFRIFMLRKAVEKDIQAPEYIRSVAGYGYRLVIPHP